MRQYLAAGCLVSMSLSGAWADSLQPHKAVYDLTLRSAEPSTSVVAASGRLVFELQGSACDGYTVDFRNVTRVTDREGAQRTTDLRSSTTETLAPPVLVFDHETVVDGMAPSGIKGRAESRAGGVAVAVEAPKETTVSLVRAIFPTAHTRLILEAAEAGERVLEARVFDGGDEADTIYETATLIGPGQTGLPRASVGEMGELAAIPNVERRTVWRLVISYFEDNEQSGERVPDYELTFSMLDNGIAYDVVFDYGTFAMEGELTELIMSDKPTCSID
ncbi:MAG: DUF1849 family protein [Pseudomonadota bacterium]